MKKHLFEIIGIMSVFGLLFIGCPDGSENSDEWSKISSINEIAGKWENSFTVTVPANGDYNASFVAVFDVPIPATSVSYESYVIEYTKDANSIFVSTKMEFNKLLEDVINSSQGYTKDILWANLVSFYEPIKDIMNITIEKYYVIQDSTSYVSNFDISAFYISKDQNKLKMIVPLSSTYKADIILYKKY